MPIYLFIIMFLLYLYSDFDSVRENTLFFAKFEIVFILFSTNHIDAKTLFWKYSFSLLKNLTKPNLMYLFLI
jgi:hypothetical protein